MSLLDEIFKDLSDDIKIWHKRSNNDSKIESLKDLKNVLNGYIDSIDTEIRLQEQDKSLATIDDEMEKSWT